MNKQELAWDNLYRLGNSWKKETLTLPKIFKSKKVLEIGVGSGKTLKSILNQKPKEVYAIDISSESIKLLKNNFRISNLNLKKCSILKTPFEDNYFDVVACYYVMNNLNESERRIAVKEIIRILNHRGKVVFEDFSLEDFRNDSIRDKTKKNGIFCHFFDIPELKELFSGFSDVKIKKKTSFPIARRGDLKREVINGILVK